MPRTIEWNETHHLLEIANGPTGAFDHCACGFYFDIGDLLEVHLFDLHDALIRAHQSVGSALSIRDLALCVSSKPREGEVSDPTSHEYFDVWRVDNSGQLRVEFRVDRPRTYKAEDAEGIIQAILRPWSSRLISYEGDPTGMDDGCPAAEIVAVFELDHTMSEARRAMSATREALKGSDANLHTAPGIFGHIKLGNVEALLGMPELPILDVKKQLYRLTTGVQKHEYALDLASFANTSTGGLIVIGLATGHVDHQGDIIQQLTPTDLSLFSVNQYLDVANHWIIPPIEGIAIDTQRCRDGHLVLILIPPQPERSKPYLVRGGASMDGKFSKVAITLVERMCDRKTYWTIDRVQSLLSTGRATLRGEGGPR